MECPPEKVRLPQVLLEAPVPVVLIEGRRALPEGIDIAISAEDQDLLTDYTTTAR